jgi:hypothetical protein
LTELLQVCNGAGAIPAERRQPDFVQVAADRFIAATQDGTTVLQRIDQVDR